MFWKWANDENPLLVEEAETGSQFHKDMLDHMFMGWLASASRDGYKLVPVEPTQGMIESGCKNITYNTDDVIPVYKKAMLGAIDD